MDLPRAQDISIRTAGEGSATRQDQDQLIAIVSIYVYIAEPQKTVAKIISPQRAARAP